MKNKKFIFYTRRDEISKISLFFGPGRHAMSVGPKWRDLGRVWVTIVTDAASLSHLDSDHASNTFLVLGPIDLTNGRVFMPHELECTLRGTGRQR
jgi:hypothetical protein